jgi:hypothetical protein
MQYRNSELGQAIRTNPLKLKKKKESTFAEKTFLSNVQHITIQSAQVLTRQKTVWHIPKVPDLNLQTGKALS